MEYSKDNIHFLDLDISKNDKGCLHTSIFRKPTDGNTILRADSFHPKRLKENIPYGQFQRVRRICDQETDYSVKSAELENRFLDRGYSVQVLKDAGIRAGLLDRGNLLRRGVPRDTSKRVYFVTKYSTEAENIKRIIKNNWGIIQSDTLLRQIFPEPPVISFKRCPTLNDKLVHSYLPGDSQKTWLDHKPKGSFKCNQCNHCSNIVQKKYFVDTASKMEYYLKHFINCKTTHVIYRLECPQCKVFYIGRTKRRLQDRLAEHKYAIRVGNEDYPMARHYKSLHHGNPASLQAMGIDHVPASIRKGDRLKQLNQRESFWIYKLQATKYPGLNEDMDFSPFL
ncbi:uncharacterized protein LOC129842721 [Salvelinus fontinalis]|uniref:uncharacterized protein LOC129842721 n=1 Tax=Salvelinus fontinalis TaxID=8038 RepID=UPI0024852CA4|nr:uncharacterized protein LOC129842721 [Salvelinus fontinalis]XP_055767332.1 uncharacterized protein LOC129842721 [Salvelinus fontinalis]